MSTEGLGVHKTLTFPIIYKWICSQRILLELEYLKLTLYVKHSTPSTPPISSSCMRHKQEDFLSTGWVNIALWDIHKLSWQNYAEYWPLPPPFVDKFTKISLCIVFDILWTPSFPMLINVVCECPLCNWLELKCKEGTDEWACHVMNMLNQL